MDKNLFTKFQDELFAEAKRIVPLAYDEKKLMKYNENKYINYLDIKYKSFKITIELFLAGLCSLKADGKDWENEKLNMQERIEHHKKVLEYDNEERGSNVEETVDLVAKDIVDNYDKYKNQSYTGDLIQGKRKRISHKVHKDLEVSEDNWIIVSNHHKALIEKDDFEKVQELLYARNIRVNKNNEYDIFAGHLRCDKCGNSLVLRKSKKYEYYYCKSYLYNKECSKHTCQKKQLEQDVVDVINRYKEIIEDMDSKINEILNKKDISYDLEIIKNKIQNAEEKKEKYIMLRNSIKEDLKEKFISEEEYWQYNNEYSEKIKKLKQDIELFEKEREKETEKSNNVEWMNIFKNYEKINELNRLLVDELIEDIVISEDGNLKVIFKYEDKYFEALDFINKQKCDIMLTS